MQAFNIIQTLSFAKMVDPYKVSLGWVAPEYHLMSWALSCLQIKKLYGKVELYCNDKAAQLLINELELPYCQVHTTHNDFILPDKRLWALPKILTYSLQTKPFLHVDGDVFLFDTLPIKLLEGNLIAQNVEEATNYYTQTQDELVNNFSYFPKCVEEEFKKDDPIKAVNAGILGGKNIEFIKEYADLAFKYVNNNISHLNSINVDRFNVFFEQHLFYSLAKEKGINIEVLINSTIKDNQYLYLGNFHETPCKRNYLHLLGHYKKDEHTCRLMAAKLRELHPQYYYKIISLFKNKTKSNYFFLYNEPKFDSISSYLKFSEKSLSAFKENSNKSVTNKIKSINSKSTVLALLDSLISDMVIRDGFTKENLLEDFQNFSNSILAVINNNERPANEFIYGRDLDSVNWYCKIFEDEVGTMNKTIIKCDEINIITSKFDWAGLYIKNTRSAVRYYEDLELTPSEFFTVVTLEINEDGFAIQDIDEMEYIILSHLQSRTRIEDLFTQMLDYVEEDIINNYLDDYKGLFLEMLKQLIIKKAIMPARNTKTSIA